MIHEEPSNNGDLGSPPGSPKDYIIFTDKSIKYLKPGHKRRVVWASGLKGLGIRITPKGTKSFVFKYDNDGQDRWITFGQYPKMKLAEALVKYANALDQIEEGDDPAEDSVVANRASRRAATVRQLADDYIDKYAKPRKRSWREDERILQRDVLPRWGLKKASKISRKDIIELLDEIVARGAPVGANRTLAVIRRMFNFAVDRDVLQASPCHRIKPPSSEQSKDRYLTLDEIKDFWNGLDTAPLTRQMILALKLILLTLQRTSEVIGMSKSELDLRGRTWTIPSERTKNKRVHLVPLSPAAMEIIAELLKSADQEGYLLPGEGGADGHLTRWAVSKAVQRNLEHFGISKFTPHDLRRTGSTQLAAFKVPRFDRDRVLNHTDLSIGAVYDVHEYQDEKRAALNLWADIVTRCAKSPGKVDARKLRATLKYPKYFAG